MPLDDTTIELVKSRLPQIQKALEQGRSALWVYQNIFAVEKASGRMNHREIEDAYLHLTRQTMTEAREVAKARGKLSQDTEDAQSIHRRYVKGIDLAQYKGAKDIPAGIIQMVLDDLIG